MRTLFFGLLLTLLASATSTAQTAKISLRGGGPGKISVARGKMRATINLSQEVAGCAFAAGALKRDLDAKECTAPPAEFELVDATTKNNRTFLVVRAEAMGNCNVCGQCGATEAFTLIWLKLDARLRLLEKKSVPLEYCRGGISLISPQIGEAEYTNEANLKLPFAGDLLTVEFEQQIYGADDASSYEFSRLVYNRKTPEKGFVIKTEKRTKSAADDVQQVKL